MAAEPLVVLIIDDNPQLLKVFTQGLPLVGDFTVYTAENGGEGLERFYEVHPDCVVIDVKMPELDGYQLTRAIRGDPSTAATPLIILTAMGQEWDRYVGIVSGVDRYMIKPVRPSELAEAIREACAMSEEQRLQRLQELVDAPPPQNEG
jgi:CheY-like chemotaxis protein